jgi:hypothetical protein
MDGGGEWLTRIAAIPPDLPHSLLPNERSSPSYVYDRTEDTG